MVVDYDKKARGAFFTPSELTTFVSSWAIRTSADRVLEPSCGEASFLLASADRLSQLGASADELRLHGTEIHQPSAIAAEQLLGDAGFSAEITVGDFFDQLPSPVFDVVVGNPPYIRYQQFTGESRAKAQAAALASGVRLPGLASSWAAFVVQSSRFLKPGGRLGLVLPAELLNVNYAAPVRRFLLERFARVTLVTFENLVFPDVQAEVVLLLAEGEGPSDFIHVAALQDLDGLHELASKVGGVKGWRPDSPSGKWIGALLPEGARETYLDVLGEGAFSLLSEWGTVNLGAVTGNNNYFALTRDHVNALGLQATDLVRISPPGSKHLRGLTFSARDLETERERGRATCLFRPASPLSDAAARYLAIGESASVNETYKCRTRTPWWIVPLPPTPDLLFTYMSNDYPRFIANGARAQYLNSLHGIVLRQGFKTRGMELLPLGALNSLTALGAELVGRSYGGGVLKLEPREVGLLPVPSPTTLEQAAEQLRVVRDDVSCALANGDFDAAMGIVDRVLLTDVLKVAPQRIIAIQEARARMRDRRGQRLGGSRR